MIEINFQQLEENIAKLSHINPVMVIKNNAYNTNLEKTFKLALKYHIKYFSSTNLEELIFLRKQNKDVILILLGIPNLDDVVLYLKYDITISLNSMEEVQQFKEYSLKCHLKINLMMNRFGIKITHLKQVLAKINTSNLVLMGAYSHLFTKEKVLYSKQVEMFEESIKYLPKNLFLHLNSTAYLNKPSPFHYRLGMAFYEKVFKLSAKVIKVNEIKMLDYLGYGLDFQALETLKIAILDIGYYHGYRKNGIQYAKINHKYYEVVGKICMNYCFILVDDEIEIGSTAMLIGDDKLDFDYMTNHGMTYYELITSFR